MNTYPRVIEVEDEKLLEYINKKAEWLTKGRELSKQIDDLEQERNKCGLQIDKYKEKIIPRTNELAKPYITDEFEELETVKAENGKIIFTIINRCEDWKKAYLEQKSKQ